MADSKYPETNGTQARVHKTFAEQVRDRQGSTPELRQEPKPSFQMNSRQTPNSYEVHSHALKQGVMHTWDKSDAERIAKAASQIPPHNTAVVKDFRSEVKEVYINGQNYRQTKERNLGPER